MVKVKDQDEEGNRLPDSGRGRPTIIRRRPSDGVRIRVCGMCLRTKEEGEYYNIEKQSYCAGCMKVYQRLKKLMISGDKIRAYIRGEIPLPVDDPRVKVKEEPQSDETTTTTAPAKTEKPDPDYGPEDEIPEGEEVEIKPLDPDSDNVDDKWEGAHRAGKQDYGDDDDEELDW